MPNAMTESSAKPPSGPRVPESLRRLLADPYAMGTETAFWTLPAVLPGERAIREAIGELGRALEPARPALIEDCVKALAHGTAHKAASTKDWRYQTRLYGRTLADIPEDIWVAVTKELLLTYEWFPGTAAIAKRAAPLVEERRRMLERARRMLAKIDETTQAAAPARAKAMTPDEIKSTSAERMRQVIATYRRIGRDADADRVQRDLDRCAA